MDHPYHYYKSTKVERRTFKQAYGIISHLTAVCVGRKSLQHAQYQSIVHCYMNRVYIDQRYKITMRSCVQVTIIVIKTSHGEIYALK